MKKYSILLFIAFFTSNLFSQNISISGTIKNTVDRPICDVEVYLLSGGNIVKSIMADDNGNYIFEDLVGGRNYEIQVSKEGEELNGMSTFDIVLIKKHILGEEEITNPFLLYSGDINGNLSLDVQDLVLYRRFVIGIDDQLSAPSWQFFNRDITFNDPLNPWQTTNVRTRTYENLTTSITDANFIGSKTGDIDDSANSCED